MGLEERSYLHTSQYARRRKRRGCTGCFILVVLLVIVIAVLGQIPLPSTTPIPVFGYSVGVVRIEGPINESQHVNKILKSFRDSPLIKAVVLRLDTPGGAVGASEEIFREAKSISEKAKKPVIVSMGNAAASGGYYIAMAADEIFANAGTLTGSIGVIAMDWNIEPILRKVGVRSQVLKSGEHKDSGSPFREMRPEDRAYLQGVIFDTYRQFFRTVLQARHGQIDEALHKRQNEVMDILSTATTKLTSGGLEWQAFKTGSVATEIGVSIESEVALHEMADGRIFSGEQAVKLGLIDHIGTLEDAIERAAQLAKLGKNPPVVERSPESAIPSLLGSRAREFWQEFTRSDSTLEFRGGLDSN
jgi:protease-4